MTEVRVARLPIKLDDFLKLAQAVSSGGEAKLRLLQGEIEVNGERETRRGRRLHAGDRVTVAGTTTFLVVGDPSAH